MATQTDTDLKKPRTLWEMIKSHPTGFWFIFWGELAERCSFYGMMAILARFLSEALYLGDGVSGEWVSYFKAAAYTAPLLGGFVADNYLGKYRLIVIFSIPYILGHVILFEETVFWTVIALSLLALGSGVIKPNISTLMGMTYDQKRPNDEALRTMAFGMFYMAINIGAFVSYWFMPDLRDALGYKYAFLFPAGLMAISFTFFAIGKPFYAVEKIQRHVTTPEEWAEKKITLRRIAGLFLVITFFWAVFDQSHTTWVFYARDFTDLSFFGWRTSPDKLGAINPLLIVLFVPMLTVFWNRMAARGIKPRPTDKIMAGFFLTLITMGIMAVSGALVASYEVRPALKGNDKDAPYIVTSPDTAVSALTPIYKQRKENLAEVFENVPDKKQRVEMEKAAAIPPALTDVKTVDLIWVVKSEKPNVDKQPGKLTVSWGEKPNQNVVLTWPKGFAEPTVEIDPENRVTITSADPFNVTYNDGATVTKKKIVSAKDKVSVWWEVLAFITLTLAEVLISVTGLELAFVVSPKSMKSFVTALWLLTVAIANMFINAPVSKYYETWSPDVYFSYLTALMVGVIVVFYFVAQRFNKLGAEQAAIAEKAVLAAAAAEGLPPPPGATGS